MKVGEHRNTYDFRGQPSYRYVECNSDRIENKKKFELVSVSLREVPVTINVSVAIRGQYGMVLMCTCILKQQGHFIQYGTQAFSDCVTYSIYPTICCFLC